MKKQLLLLICIFFTVLSAQAQQDVFSHGAACFVPVGSFNKYCAKKDGVIGYAKCPVEDKKAGQFVITKQEMDDLIKKECPGGHCNMRHIELALGIICDANAPGPWDTAHLLRVDIPASDFAMAGDITWPAIEDCGCNSCFRPGGEHRTSGGLIEGFVKPVKTTKCVINRKKLYSAN